MRATAAALEVIARLRAAHGALVFHQSGGCCDGTSPMCLLESELPAGPNDVLLGEIGGVPFYVDAEQWRRWGSPSFLIDVSEGPAGGFSLEGSEGVRFTAATPAAEVPG